VVFAICVVMTILRCVPSLAIEICSLSAEL
jgi:hypothetical protein